MSTADPTPLEPEVPPPGDAPDPDQHDGRDAASGSGADTDPDDAPAPGLDGDLGEGSSPTAAELRGAAKERLMTGAAGAADGARTLGGRVAGAAGAAGRSLRDADVEGFAHQTTSLIENTRPFFLAAFAVAFTALAWVEDHTAVALVFALGAIAFVIGAAYSREIDAILTRGGRARGDASRS
ncbi:MAG: hypothetical protein AB7G37_17410 [Solirubrobacteraceae bacterium]